jgi:hypothetical protein
LNTLSGREVTHRLRKRGVGKVVLELLGSEEVASSFRASVGVQSVLEVQETTSLGDGEPTDTGGLDGEGSLGDRVARAIFSDDTSSSSKASVATPRLVIDQERAIDVGTNSETMVEGSLDGDFDDTTI